MGGEAVREVIGKRPGDKKTCRELPLSCQRRLYGLTVVHRLL